MKVIRSNGPQNARIVRQIHWVRFKKSHVTLSLDEARHIGRLQPPHALNWGFTNCRIRGTEQYR